jgi:hypothetical protein
MSTLYIISFIEVYGFLSSRSRGMFRFVLYAKWHEGDVINLQRMNKYRFIFYADMSLYSSFFNTYYQVES